MAVVARRANLATLPNPFGPYRDIDDQVDISTEDHTDPMGFTFSAVNTGTVTFRTLLEGPDGTDKSRDLAAGDALTGPGGLPVAVIAVRANATVAQINIGYP